MSERVKRGLIGAVEPRTMMATSNETLLALSNYSLYLLVTLQGQNSKCILARLNVMECGKKKVLLCIHDCVKLGN